MTTNHIEHLDEALIRSGLTEKKVHFKLSDRRLSALLTHSLQTDARQQSSQETIRSRDD